MTPDELVQLLGSHEPPWFIGLIGEPADGCDWSWRLEGIELISRFGRGLKMADSHGLFDEIAAVLQFPSYFGENWDAFNECIRDLGGLQDRPVVLTIIDALRTLEAEPIDHLRIFISLLAGSARLQTDPMELGTEFLPSRQPFHVAFQATAREMPLLVARLAQAGAELTILDDAAWKRPD